jgi:hypothetical protein
MKFSLLVVAVLMATVPSQAQAQAAGIAIHVFGSSKCQLCGEAAAYLRTVAEREGAVVYWHDSDESPREATLMRAVAKDLQMTVDGYPFIVVGRRAHLGWKGATTGLIITNEVSQVREAGDEDVVARVEAELAAASAGRADGTPPRFRVSVTGLAALLVLVVVVVGIVIANRKHQTP